MGGGGGMFSAKFGDRLLLGCAEVLYSAVKITDLRLPCIAVDIAGVRVLLCVAAVVKAFCSGADTAASTQGLVLMLVLYVSGWVGLALSC